MCTPVAVTAVPFGISGSSWPLTNQPAFFAGSASGYIPAAVFSAGW